jgi:CDP-diacylglycerol--glycerol-3-phosphate 3-phosphatidyltransferase
LIISLTAIGLEGLGVPFALAIGIWLLLILAVVTVIQRILIVKAAL